MRSQVAAEKKEAILVKIREEKEILFGAFSDTLTKSDKVEKWVSIFDLARSLNVVPGNKDWTYVRDVFWQNCRKYALTKIENSKKTGSGGGKECKLNTCDNIVLDIIGRESEVIIGLGVPDSMTKQNDEQTITVSSKANDVSVPPLTSKQIKRKSNAVEKRNEEAFLNVKKKKMMIEHIGLLNIKARLEIALLKKKLGLPFTLEELGEVSVPNSSLNGDEDINQSSEDIIILNY